MFGFRIFQKGGGDFRLVFTRIVGRTGESELKIQVLNLGRIFSNFLRLHIQLSTQNQRKVKLFYKNNDNRDLNHRGE